MKKVLITGSSGFIGHYLVDEFVRDHEVVCLIRPETKNLNRLESYRNQIKIVEHDIRFGLDHEHPYLKNIDIVLHAGGNPSAADSLSDPVGTIADNVVGTLNILEYAKKIKAERLVYYSSGEVFGPIAVGLDSRENDSYNSNSPYAASKAAGEELCVAYSKSFDLPVSIIHINNTFGMRCQPNRLPVIIIRKILNQETLDIHVSNNVIGGRRWFYAGDVASHTRFILEKQQNRCEKWNSAGDRFITNLDFAVMISEIVGKDLKYRLVPVDRPGHDLCFSVTPEKIYDLGWSAPRSFSIRLEETVDWYLNNQDWL